MNKCLIILLVILSGCYTEKRASIQLAKAQGTYPHVVAAKCSDYYPTKDSIIRETEFIKGETSTVHDSVLIDCDTVTEVKYKNRIIRVKQPQKTRVDTYIKKVYKTVERTDKLRVKDTLLARYKSDLAFSTFEVKKYKKRSKKYMICFYSLIAILLLILFGKMYLSRFKVW